jgi:putative membrane protein
MSALTLHFDSDMRLAIDRTRLGHERAMLAWIRTAASLMSFGYVIYTFFTFFYLDRKEPQGGLTTRGFAFIMIGTGIVTLILAGHQHHARLRAMRDTYGALPRSVAEPVAVLIGLFGVVLLIGVIMQA